MPMKLRYEDPFVRIVSLKSLMISAWFNAPTMQHLRQLKKAIDEHLQEIMPAKQVFVTVVVNGTPNFADDVRAESWNLAQRNAPLRQAVAQIVELSGLRGIAARSFMSSMLLHSRKFVPTRIFDNVADAAKWLLPYLKENEDWTEEQILATYRFAAQHPPAFKT